MVNDKKMAMIMMITMVFVRMLSFWVFLQIILFIVRMSNVLPHFLDESEEIITGVVMRI